MARTVSDVVRLYEAVAGPDDGDPSSAPVPVTSAKKKKLRGMTIGYFETDGEVPVSPETRSALRRARQALEGQGCTVREFTPGGLGDIYRLWWNLFGRAIGTLLQPIVQGRELDLSATLRQFSTYVENGPALTRDELMDTLLRRDALRSGLLREMQDFPVLLCPVAAVSAFRHGEREWRIEGRRVRYLDAWRYAAWFNLTGNPAISVPVPGIAERPVGVQIVGRPWAEATVLGIAALLEEAVGIHPSPVLD
jgi:amidase